jgi:hypothetical protein
LRVTILSNERSAPPRLKGVFSLGTDNIGSVHFGAVYPRVGRFVISSAAFNISSIHIVFVIRVPQELILLLVKGKGRPITGHQGPRGGVKV